MALVKVVYTRTGKQQRMNTRFAETLAKLGKVVIVPEEEIVEVKKSRKKKATKELTAEKKKKGRPAKQTYKTKDMVAK